MLRLYKRVRSVEEKNNVACIAEGDFQDAVYVIENAENTDDWRGIDRFAEGFVVEADVAAGDGRAEFVAGDGEAVDGFAELPHDLRLFWAPEIEAVCRGDGACAAGSYV